MQEFTMLGKVLEINAVLHTCLGNPAEDIKKQQQSHQVLQWSCFTEKDIHMLYIIMLFSNSRFQLSTLLDMIVK